MRIGLVGTGPWARSTHGPGLAAAEAVDLVGVWGRDLGRTEAVARTLGVTAYGEYAALLDDIDAVAFAVPPEVQGALALQAAEAGRHLLLDKPVAVDAEDARRLAEAAAASGSASVVFFTDRFSSGGARWLEETAATGGWLGGSLRWLAALDPDGTLATTSPWRRRKGGLWDLGPHALSSLTALLGPVQHLTAVGGAGDLVHLVLTHDTGATSTVTLSILAPAAVDSQELLVWGEAGVRAKPDQLSGSAADALARAATALRRSADTGEPHPADLRLGVRVVELLEEADRQLGRG